MAAASAFVCQSCGSAQAKWSGRCDACGAWNTLVEETVAVSAPVGGKASPAPKARRGAGVEFVALDGEFHPPARASTGSAELDRVLGGGLAKGAALLVGGDPGVGKSTLLLQTAARMALSGLSVAYVSGEEAADQIRERAMRLGLADAPVALAAETALGPILDGLKAKKPDVVVIDSVQTLWTDALGAAPGSVAQVRACAQELTRFAKKRGCAVILVGHVTKDGQIAGPRVVEHMVDTVLYLEGERSAGFRILRGVKNRFGPTDEIGVFEMAEGGLSDVANPSALFLNDRAGPRPGSVVFAGLEGSRPVLVEIQALVAPAAYGTARRAVVGWDSGRLAMVLAVLEARCGLSLAGRDVYLNVAGGLKVTEPGADLAVAVALVSAALDEAVSDRTVAFGEVSLSGDVRRVSRCDARLREAKKLGFATAYAPAQDADASDGSGMNVAAIAALGDLVARFAHDGALDAATGNGAPRGEKGDRHGLAADMV